MSTRRKALTELFPILPSSVLEHLNWLTKKHALKQDVLLLGPPPSNFSRRLAVEFSRLVKQDIEIVSITADTTEADLKTRRDLINQSIVFSDQGPVRAATQGRILVLDGLEKCERNVLPTLNNLLENREMNLDDGRLIISHHRFQHLLKSNTIGSLERSGLVPAHPDFFVVALASPIPPYVGRQMDPPLRSRFQVRRVEFPHPGELIAQGLDPAVVETASALNLACSSNPQMFPRFPDSAVFSISEQRAAGRNTSMLSLFARSYPWLVKEMNFKHRSAILGLFPSHERAETQGASEKLRTTEKEYLSADRFELVQDALSALSFQNNVLLCGPPGSGKSFLAKLLASQLGYSAQNVIVFPLHKDMTSRDLVATRSTDQVTGNTTWVSSPILAAAVRGDLLILDGLDKIDTAILSVARLLQDRELDDINGAPINVHPEFRVIALATTSSARKNSAPFLTPEILSMFSVHVLSEIKAKTDLIKLLGVEYPKAPPDKVARLVDFSLLLQSRSTDVGVAGLSIRSLKRITNRLNVFPNETNVVSLVQRSLLFSFLPSQQKEMVQRLLNESGLTKIQRTTENDASLEDHITFQRGDVIIGEISFRQLPTRDRPDLIPKVVFFDVAHHRRVLKDMLSDMVAGSKHLLLIGNQGVGKNKLSDRMLELLNAEREYVQLHRDSTISSLVGAPTIHEGRVVWEDSPLVKAARYGRILVVDEADKAPPEVVAVLKSLVEDGEMLLGSGKRLVRQIVSQRPGDIQIHEDFAVWILANRPGFPFHGNDFFKHVGDVFSTHVVGNPDPKSELELLKAYAPNTDVKLLRILVDCFAELRSLADESRISYPYSTREAVNVAKHLDAFPEDGLINALHNVVDFDSFQAEVANTLEKVFQKHGIPFTFRHDQKSKLGVNLGVTRSLPELRPSGEIWTLSR